MLAKTFSKLPFSFDLMEIKNKKRSEKAFSSFHPRPLSTSLLCTIFAFYCFCMLLNITLSIVSQPCICSLETLLPCLASPWLHDSTVSYVARSWKGYSCLIQFWDVWNEGLNGGGVNSLPSFDLKKVSHAFDCFFFASSTFLHNGLMFFDVAINVMSNR